MLLRARALVVAAVVALGLPAHTASAHAQGVDPARLTAAKEMMQAALVERQLGQMMPLLLDRLKHTFRALAPDRREIIDGVFEDLHKMFLSRRAELIDEVAAIYAQKMTTDEIKAITAFYRSPAGVRFLEVQPQIVQESMLAGQRWGEKIGREIEEEARRELKKRGLDL